MKERLPYSIDGHSELLTYRVLKAFQPCGPDSTAVSLQGYRAIVDNSFFLASNAVVDWSLWQPQVDGVTFNI